MILFSVAFVIMMVCVAVWYLLKFGDIQNVYQFETPQLSVVELRKEYTNVTLAADDMPPIEFTNVTLEVDEMLSRDPRYGPFPFTLNFADSVDFCEFYQQSG